MQMRLRAPVIDDAAAVLAVMNARDVADLGTPDDELDDVLDEWRSSDFDLAHDARLIELDGRVVAYAVVLAHGTLAVVAPDAEGRGVGTRLREWTEQRECTIGRPHRQWIASTNERGRELLIAAGYARARSYYRMALKLDDPPPPLGAPGFSLRTLVLAHDAEMLHALDARSFAALADYTPQSLEAFCEHHLEAHDLDLALSIVAEQDGRGVGFLLARRRDAESLGFVDLLAVDPDNQRRGLGRWLLLDSFARFRAAGLEYAELGVASDNPRALALYRRVGMEPRSQFDTYERPITAVK